MPYPNATLGHGTLPQAEHARRILIVDDNVDSADVMAQALQAHGHETRVAYDPFVAVTVAAELRPQLAILDVNLPGMDGYELGAALRAEFAECRLIALTGDAVALNLLRSQWAGFDGHLTKPVNLDRLLAASSMAFGGDARASGTVLKGAVFRGPSSRPPRERGQIDLLGSPEVVRYWTTELCCTEASLRAAVAEVGPSAEDVRRQLAK